MKSLRAISFVCFLGTAWFTRGAGVDAQADGPDCPNDCSCQVSAGAMWMWCPQETDHCDDFYVDCITWYQIERPAAFFCSVQTGEGECDSGTVMN